jgi:hypothetical protein
LEFFSKKAKEVKLVAVNELEPVLKTGSSPVSHCRYGRSSMGLCKTNTYFPAGASLTKKTEGCFFLIFPGRVTLQRIGDTRSLKPPGKYDDDQRHDG